MSATFNWYAFASDLEQIADGVILDDRLQVARLVRRRIAAHATLCEQLCNAFQDRAGNWDERATKRAEARLTNLERRLVAFFGAEVVHFNHDPRGGTVKLTPRRPIDGLVYFARDWGGDLIFTRHARKG